jgi:lipopolysaccharide export LptBFGC system permease protein LptF
MDKINQIEIRKDDLEPCREFEEERFEIIKRVNNYWKDEIEDGKEIKLDYKLKVDFAEINVPKTEDEIWRSREEQEKRFMATPKDWLKEDNPDLTDEEAENLLKENKELMDSTVNAEPKTNFQKLLDNNLTTNEESENG